MKYYTRRAVNEMLQPVMSVKEAAGYLKVQPRTIRDWIAAGRIMARKVGKSYIIPEVEIGRIVAAAQQPVEATRGQSQSAQFRALLRGGHRIDKLGIRTEWDEDADYEGSRCEPR